MGPTRGNNPLDLLLTSCRENIKTLSGISGNDLIHICIAAPLKNTSPTQKIITDYNRGNIPDYNRENFDALDDDLTNFLDDFRNT